MAVAGLLGSRGGLQCLRHLMQVANVNNPSGEFANMITGSAYIVATIFLAFFLRYASKEAHEVTDKEDVFRYPKVFRLFFLFIIPVVIGAAVLVIATARPGIDTPLLMGIGMAVLLCIDAGFCYGYLYLKRFYLTVDNNSIRWGAFKSKSLSFADMKRIEVRKMEKGGMQLTIYGPDDHKVLTTSNVIQDFDDLVALVTRYGKQAGVNIVMK